MESPTLSERLRESCQIRVERCLTQFVHTCTNISMSCGHGRRPISAFKIYGDELDNSRIFCVTCESIISEDKKTNREDLKNIYHILSYQQNIWGYHTCPNCTNVGIRLCPTSLTSNYKCCEVSVPQLYESWLWLRLFMVTDDDVVSMIMKYLVELLPCQSCFLSLQQQQTKPKIWRNIYCYGESIQ
jgi:hypothetical protein